jgi:hypothetical protein
MTTETRTRQRVAVETVEETEVECAFCESYDPHDEMVWLSLSNDDVTIGPVHPFCVESAFGVSVPDELLGEDGLKTFKYSLSDLESQDASIDWRGQLAEAPIGMVSGFMVGMFLSVVVFPLLGLMADTARLLLVEGPAVIFEPLGPLGPLLIMGIMVILMQMASRGGDL